MLQHDFFGWIALVAALSILTSEARGADAAKYSDFRGQWIRSVGAQWDPSKPQGLKQDAPLTPKSEAIFKANLNEQATGGEGYNPQAKCIPAGMPRMMIAYEPMEVIVTPDTTYIWVEQMNELRRIYTDGRDWPKGLARTLAGYSIGANGRIRTAAAATIHS